MKRLFVLGCTILAFGASVFATNNQAVVEKLSERDTFYSVVRHVNADMDQRDNLRYIFNETSKRFNRETKRGLSVEDAAQKALYFNLANAKAILSPDQYRKFLQVVNSMILDNEDVLYLSVK